jgi:phosphoadenosine phosphosulfate reductase
VAAFLDTDQRPATRARQAMNLNLEQINQQLQDKSPEEILRWALGLGKRVLTTTSFSPNSAAMLHLVTTIQPDMQVVWIDSGYNVADAYRTAQQIIERLQPNLRVYIPEITAERRNALMGGIPHPADDAELFQEFVRQVKLEPFQRAIDEIRPEVWLTGIRREETEFRKTLDIVTWDNRGLLRVAPLFHWSEEDLLNYMERFDLPSCKHYFDPTKIADNAECGLHTAA